MPYDVFFKLKALAPLPFSIVAIISLFLGADLISKLGWIMELDLGVFPTDSSICLTVPINLEKEESTSSPGNSILVHYAMAAYVN